MADGKGLAWSALTSPYRQPNFLRLGRLSLDGDDIRPVRPEETEHYRVMRSFLGNPERALRALLSEDDEVPEP